MSLRITEPEPNPEKPGLSGPLRTAVLSGNNVSGEFGMGVTEVDADLWKAFSGSEAYSACADNLREVDGDEDLSVSEFGFEPALHALANDKGNTKAAKKGSTMTDPAPVAAVDMKTGSNDPVAVVASPAGSDAAKAKPGK
jgi:hypothetical protein